MPNDELFNDFISKEIRALEILLVSKAERTAITLESYINSRLVQGATPDAIESFLLEDLDNNGPIFGEFKRAIRATANGAINRGRDSALFSDDTKTIAEEQYRWVAVLVNTCPDCLERHGVSLTYAEWEEEGLPRTGATVCQENCKCMLLPASSAIIEPISRKRQ